MPAAGRLHSQPFAIRLAAFYAALFLAVGVQLPFFPLWLAAKGLDATLIGAALSIPMVVRVVAIPLVSHWVDSRGSIRAVLALATICTALCYGVLGLMDGAGPILLLCSAAAIVYAPVMSLTDAYALRGLAAHGRTYGPVRLWGSAAFVAGVMGAGAVADIVPKTDLIWLIVAGSVLCALASTRLIALPAAAVVAAASPARPLLRQPGFLVVLVAAALIQASHAVYYGFSTLQWTAAGLDGTAVAALWALGVVAEIALFALQRRLPVWLTPTLLMLLGAAGAALRWSLMAFSPAAGWLPLLQCLHALSFGCTHLGALGCLARVVPAGHTARAQGYLSVTLGVVMAGVMSASGLLVTAYGAGAYAAMALVALAGGACALVAQRLQRGVAN